MDKRLSLVMAQIDRRLSEEGRAAVALDGPCGSGKTTLAGELGQRYHTQPISMDDFFLPPALRTPERLAQPGGNVHYERFLSEVLKPLETGKPFSYGRFDCQSGRVEPCACEPGPVMVIEGSYSHHPAFEESYGRLRVMRVFLDMSPDEQLRRLAARDPAKLEAFQTRWIPLEKTYFEAYDRRNQADMVLSGEGGVGE